MIKLVFRRRLRLLLLLYAAASVFEVTTAAAACDGIDKKWRCSTREYIDHRGGGVVGGRRVGEVVLGELCWS